MGLNRLLGDLAHNLDSAAVGSYQGKSDFSPIAYSSLSGTPSTILDSAVATSIVDSAYIGARQASGFTNIDSALASNVVDSAYINARIGGGGSGFFVYEFETTAGQTAIQDSDLNGNLMSYTAEGILVFKNGVLLLDSDDYTATDGNVVTLTSAADSGSNITISKFALGGGGSSATWYGSRGLIMGGTYPVQNTIDYITIQSTGNATDFGDLDVTREDPTCFSDGTQGFGACGYDGSSNTQSVSYVTVATTGNASDFGDMTVTRNYGAGGACDGTYGLVAGNGTSGNVIDYITTATPGNGTDFGDLSSAGRGSMGGNDATRACFGGRQGGSIVNTIDYVTVQTPGNATDFGDLTYARKSGCSVSDTTRIVFAGGQGASYSNVIDYITTQTTGNATDFGDTTQAFGWSSGGMSDASRGVYQSMNGGNYSNVIEYITIQTTGNATDFGDRTNTYSNVGSCAGT